MKIKPLENLTLVELLEEPKEDSSSIIQLPDRQIGRFARYKILDKGDRVEKVQVGDEVFANPVMEIIDVKNPKVGFLNMHDILAKIEK